MRHLRVEQRETWRRWVTPSPLAQKPTHRWYVFPHSFTSELVDGLIGEWGLGTSDRILDPFVGAGTTLLAAKERDIPAVGYDLSPLAVLVSRVKIASYTRKQLESAWKQLNRRMREIKPEGTVTRAYPELVRRALPGRVLDAFDAILTSIGALCESEETRAFFVLALLAAVPMFSRAVATGGWLKWVNKASDAGAVLQAFADRVAFMLEDVGSGETVPERVWQAFQADARALPDGPGAYSAVITSPPYPNRHDYTRIFGVELQLAFLDWDGVRHLRYQSFHSHPEARPDRPEHNEYNVPVALQEALSQVAQRQTDPRVTRMLEGYFLDLYLSLKESARVARAGARIAYVLGNAQYSGVPILVDESAAELGENVGLRCDGLVVVRERGNSAQQMGTYGRRPSRESIVVFRKS